MCVRNEWRLMNWPLAINFVPLVAIPTWPVDHTSNAYLLFMNSIDLLVSSLPLLPAGLCCAIKVYRPRQNISLATILHIPCLLRVCFCIQYVAKLVRFVNMFFRKRLVHFASLHLAFRSLYQIER